MTSVIKVDTIQSAAGSTVLEQTNATTITLGSTGQTILLNANATNNFAVNTPAFLATNGSTDQQISDDVGVKITLGTEIIDTNNAFSSSRFTVPSGEGGTYLISAGIDFFSGSNNMQSNNLIIQKNGSVYYQHTFNGNGNANMRRITPVVTILMDLSVGDYIELYGSSNRTDDVDTDIKANNGATFFQGYKLIGA